MSQLRFDPPGSQEPGWIRRCREVSRLLRNLPEFLFSEDGAEDLFGMVLPYITEPEDETEARELLLDASQEQWMDMLGAILLGGLKKQNPTSAPTNGA